MSEERRNDRTTISSIPAPADPQTLLRKAHEETRAEIARLAALPGHGFVVAGVTPGRGQAVVRRVAARPGDAVVPVVVGRHDHADLVLEHDPDLSLRHALVLLRVDAMGFPLARVLDLRTPAGLVDADGNAHYSLAANGPLALRLASSVLFVVPAGTRPLPGSAGNFAGEGDATAWPRPEPWIPDVPAERRLRDISRVTGASSVVSAVGGTGVGVPRPRRRRGRRVGRLALEHGDVRYDRDVDRPALRAGVLVGRYDRCDVSVLDVDMPDVVSRVHALLIAVDERPHAFDVGSTNGLVFEGFPVRGLPLPEHQPAVLEMGEGVRMTWWPG